MMASLDGNANRAQRRNQRMAKLRAPVSIQIKVTILIFGKRLQAPLSIQLACSAWWFRSGMSKRFEARMRVCGCVRVTPWHLSARRDAQARP